MCSLDGNRQDCYGWREAHLAFTLPGPPASIHAPSEPFPDQRWLLGARALCWTATRPQLTPACTPSFSGPAQPVL